MEGRDYIDIVAASINKSERKIIDSKRDFAVFMPLVMHEPTLGGEAEPCLLLELRGKNIHRQPGEISFPGGEVEKGETFKEAAIRETCEELGIAESDIEVLAEFDSLVNYSGFTIHIYYGTIAEEALSRLSPNSVEVAEIFYVPVRLLLAAEANAEPEWNIEAGRIDYSLPHVKIVVQVPEDFPYAQLGLDHSYGWRVGDMAIPVYQYGPYGIWGITGRIIQAFLTYLK